MSLAGGLLRARKQIWDGQYDMLVLTLELSDAIKPALKKIIKAWLVDGTPFEDIQALLPQPSGVVYKNTDSLPALNDDGA